MQAVIYSMVVFSGLSGSKIADIAMVGPTLHETTKRQGYSRAEAGAVVVAAAAMGETIPPSIVLLLLGSISSLGVTTLFAAGLLPAAMLAVSLSVAVYVHARRKKRLSEPITWRTLGRAAAQGTPSIVMPIVLVIGIVVGFATPTEVSGFAVAYALVLVLIGYRSMSPRGALELLAEASAMGGMLLVIAAAASGFAWAMAVSGASGAIIAGITAAGAHVWAFWVVAMAAMLILGLVLEGAPAVLIFGPLLLPVAGTLGINQVHFGICLIVAYGLGFFAPPLGAGLFQASMIMEVPPMELAKQFIPWWLLLLAGLIVLCAIPNITLFLPHLLGLPGT
jgi:tripartite ATP-independent transporter DctM subunit